ncbi:hypothetical protein ACROYT_G014741 [Oculina patagonica]
MDVYCGAIEQWSPPKDRARVVEEKHDPHTGICSMKPLAKSYVWWPKMDADLQQKVHQCSPCQESWKSLPEAPLHCWVGRSNQTGTQTTSINSILSSLHPELSPHAPLLTSHGSRSSGQIPDPHVAFKPPTVKAAEIELAQLQRDKLALELCTGLTMSSRRSKRELLTRHLADNLTWDTFPHKPQLPPVAPRSPPSTPWNGEQHYSPESSKSPLPPASSIPLLFASLGRSPDNMETRELEIKCLQLELQLAQLNISANTESTSHSSGEIKAGEKSLGDQRAP